MHILIWKIHLSDKEMGDQKLSTTSKSKNLPDKELRDQKLSTIPRHQRLTRYGIVRSEIIHHTQASKTYQIRKWEIRNYPPYPGIKDLQGKEL